MSDPIFLDRQGVEKLHYNSFQKYGGASGLRDANGIESATYLDGNKRTAMSAALSFLQINSVEEWPEGDVLYEAMIAIAEKRLDKTGLAELFRRAANSAS